MCIYVRAAATAGECAKYVVGDSEALMVAISASNFCVWIVVNVMCVYACVSAVRQRSLLSLATYRAGVGDWWTNKFHFENYLLRIDFPFSGIVKFVCEANATAQTAEHKNWFDESSRKKSHRIGLCHTQKSFCSDKVWPIPFRIPPKVSQNAPHIVWVLVLWLLTSISFVIICKRCRSGVTQSNPSNKQMKRTHTQRLLNQLRYDLIKWNGPRCSDGALRCVNARSVCEGVRQLLSLPN